MTIALVVGTIMTLINQADVILGGGATTGTRIKAVLNYCARVVVSNLGLLAGSAPLHEERASGRPAGG